MWICFYSQEFPWPPSWSLPLGPILSGVELPDFPFPCWEVTGAGRCSPAPHGPFSESLGADVATKAPGFLSLYIWVRLTARLKANHPVPVRQDRSFAV